MGRRRWVVGEGSFEVEIGGSLLKFEGGELEIKS
jgi:hypothetical protein